MIDSDFSELLGLLTASRIRFIVVGGVACALNGYVRATEDVDIIIDAAPDNVTELLRVLREWGDGYARDLVLSDFGLEPGAVRLVEEFPLDIFTVLSERRYEDFRSNAKQNSDGILYLHPSDIIATKQTSLREKDKLDIMAMTRIIGANAQ